MRDQRILGVGLAQQHADARRVGVLAVMAVKVRRRLVAPSAAGSGMPVKAVGKAGADPEGELRKGIA